MSHAEAALRHQAEFAKTTLGFWVYLMTDCVLFACLFATYAVLRGGTAGGPTGAQLFDLNFILIETLLLLASSLTTGIALVGLAAKQTKLIWASLGLTFLLGAGFLGMELYEFGVLLAEGHGPQASAFLTAYFTLVGTHGFHIAVGLLWLLVLVYFLYKRGVTSSFEKRLTMFALFWHFLDIIWIFIFTLVYLMGALS